MNYPYWDSPTFLFYYSVGILCAVLIGLHFGNLRIGRNAVMLNGSAEKVSWKGYIPLIIILTLFAALRKVGYNLGGTDSMNYEERFLNILHDRGRYETTDILFGQYIYIIRSITSSPFIYRLISYTFIAYTHCYFIKRICPDNVSCVPFILIVWPYICGFSSMRNTMAIGLLLLALVAYYDKKYIMGILFFIAAVLVHRMTFIFAPLFILYKPLSKFITSSTRGRLFFVLTIAIIMAYFASRVLQSYVVLFNVLDNEGSADASYIAKTLDTNVFKSWPMYIQQVLLLLFLFINYKQFKSPKEQFILVISCFDFLITIPALVLGLWRISQCLYIPTLMLWGVLINTFNHKFKPYYRPWISLIFLLGFTFILYKRLDSVYESSSLMPYVFFWN